MSRSILESLAYDCTSPLVFLPLNTQSWLIIRQMSDFILCLHEPASRQPGVSAAPKSPTFFVLYCFVAFFLFFCPMDKPKFGLCRRGNRRIYSILDHPQLFPSCVLLLS